MVALEGGAIQRGAVQQTGVVTDREAKMMVHLYSKTAAGKDIETLVVIVRIEVVFLSVATLACSGIDRS